MSSISYRRIILGQIMFSLFMFNSVFCFAQIDSLTIQAEMAGVVGAEGYGSYWQVNNRYGLFNDSTNDLLWLAGFRLPMKIGPHLKIEAGFNAAVKYRVEQSFIHEAYINVSWDQLKLIAGRQKFTFAQYSTSLSSGSYLVSSNTLPIPRVGIGFYDYVDVPFTKGYLQVKGILNHGWMEGDRLHHSPLNHPLLHEKMAYIRTGNLPVNPHIGISHLAMYGGEDKNGRKIGIDYWAVFFGKGSDQVNNQGEVLNAAGEHLAVFDVGAHSEISGFDLTFYYQKPITDRSGYVKNFSRNHDFFMGLLIESPERKIISAWMYEFNHTKHQSGDGIPDPRVGGRLIVPGNESDREYLKDYYGSRGYPVDEIETESEWTSFLEAYTNHGYEFGGRNDFYNNYLYTYVYKDRIMGSPLFYTQPAFTRMTGETDQGEYIVNNRILAHHMGITGYFFQNLNYRLLITYTRNYGAWQEYGGPTRWEGIVLDPDYNWFWEGSKTQWYSLMEASYPPKFLNGLEITLSLGYDFGDIDKNFGILGGIKYSPVIRLVKH